MKSPSSLLSSKTNPRNDIATGLFFGLWCLVGWWSVFTSDELWSDDYGLDPGPGLLPKLILSVLTLGGLVILLRGVIALSRTRPPRFDWGAFARQIKNPALLVGSLLLYLPAIFRIGFVTASAVFALGWMLGLGLQGRRQASIALGLQTILGTVIGVGLIYFVFIRLIGVPLR